MSFSPEDFQILNAGDKKEGMASAGGAVESFTTRSLNIPQIPDSDQGSASNNNTDNQQSGDPSAPKHAARKGFCSKLPSLVGGCGIFLSMAMLWSGVIMTVIGYEDPIYKGGGSTAKFLQVGGIIFVCAGIAGVIIGCIYYNISATKAKVKKARIKREQQPSGSGWGNRQMSPTEKKDYQNKVTGLFKVSEESSGKQRDEAAIKKQHEFILGDQPKSSTADNMKITSTSHDFDNPNDALNLPSTSGTYSKGQNAVEYPKYGNSKEKVGKKKSSTMSCENDVVPEAHSIISKEYLFIASAQGKKKLPAIPNFTNTLKELD